MLPNFQAASTIQSLFTPLVALLGGVRMWCLYALMININWRHQSSLGCYTAGSWLGLGVVGIRGASIWAVCWHGLPVVETGNSVFRGSFLEHAFKSLGRIWLWSGFHRAESYRAMLSVVASLRQWMDCIDWDIKWIRWVYEIYLLFWVQYFEFIFSIW